MLMLACLIFGDAKFFFFHFIHRLKIFSLPFCQEAFYLLQSFAIFSFQVPGAIEYAISSDDIFSLKKSPGKT